MENEYESYDCLGCSNAKVNKAQMPEHRYEYNYSILNSEKTATNIINSNKNNIQIIKKSNHEIKF